MIIDPQPPEAPRRRWPFLAGWSLATMTIILALLFTHTPVSERTSVAIGPSAAPSRSVSRSASTPGFRVQATPAPSPTRVPIAVPVHVIGTVVDDAGTGISGVEIVLGNGVGLTSSDDRGVFALTYETIAAAVPLDHLMFMKQGFEPEEVLMGPTVINVRLRRVVSIAQNAAIRLTLDRLDGFCGGTDLNMELGWRCRRVHLTSTAPGTLRVAAETEQWLLGLELRGGFANPVSPCCWPPLQVHVAANTDGEIDVLWMGELNGPPDRIDITLKTSFAPDGQ